MLFKILTTNNCGRCAMVKMLLQQKGYDFEEVSINTEEGKGLINQFNIQAAGTVVDDDKNEIVDVFKLK